MYNLKLNSGYLIGPGTVSVNHAQRSLIFAILMGNWYDFVWLEPSTNKSQLSSFVIIPEKTTDPSTNIINDKFSG